MVIKVEFDTNSADSYRLFLKVRSLPQYRISGRRAFVPDEYASMLGITPERTADQCYSPSPFLYDYQAAISELAIRKRKFAVFADCGLGKWLMICEFARHAVNVTGKRALIVMPLLCIPQQIAETEKFYGHSLAVKRCRQVQQHTTEPALF